MLGLPTFLLTSTTPIPQHLSGRVTNVLLALESLFLEDLKSVEKSIGRFVAARLLLGHRVAVSPWQRVLLEPAPLSIASVVMQNRPFIFCSMN